MPIRVEDTRAAGTAHPNPFVGPINHTVAIRVDVSTLTTAEVDEQGYIRAGVPLQASGALVSAPGQIVWGCVVEPVKIADDNVAGTLAAAADVDVAVATIAQVNQDILEDALGRALTADEIAAFDAGTLRLV